MNHPLSKRVIIYSTLFITGTMSLPRLLARGELLNNLVPFSWAEWLVSLITSCLFCMAVLSYNKRNFHQFNAPFQLAGHGKMILANIFLLLVFSFAGGSISRLFIQSRFFLFNGYLLRMIFIHVLLITELKVLATLYYAGQKERENEQLRYANTSMELELLKAQLDPHFFFNALSSLSAVVRENPAMAQQYIAHLSKIFRYSLYRPAQSLVTLKEELDELHSYSELMRMRYEGGFKLEVRIDPRHYPDKLPHMSLQPLIENALKHNIATTDRPLSVLVCLNGDMLEVSNNLQPKSSPEPGAGIGLGNLNERYKILSGKEIGIFRGQNKFLIKLPLQ
ncbi:MAG TPA: histidine kinase [Puia sp.]|nr:histidine kinase [Puia sp.]